MRNIVEAIRIADTMTEARDSLRGILGDDYDTAIEPYRLVIQERAAERGVSAMAVLPDLLRTARDHGGRYDVAKLLAATLDLVEAGMDRKKESP